MVHIDVPRGAVLHEGQLHGVHVPHLGGGERNVQFGQLQNAFWLLVFLNVVPRKEDNIY